MRNNQHLSSSQHAPHAHSYLRPGFLQQFQFLRFCSSGEGALAISALIVYLHGEAASFPFIRLPSWGGVEDSAAIVYDQDEHEMFAYIWAVLLLSD